MVSFLSVVLFCLHGPLGPSPKPPAYLDPGTGSLLLQLLIGALIGAGLLLRSRWAQLRRIFTKDEQGEASGSAEGETAEDERTSEP